MRGQQQGDTLALVPVWDMCNHEEGGCTTSFDPEKGLECHATAANATAARRLEGATEEER